LRWLKKREYMVFAYLSLKYAGSVVSFHDAVYEVGRAMGMSPKTAKNIVKRLLRAGYLARTDRYFLLVRSLQEVTSEMLVDYICKRKKRRSSSSELDSTPRRKG